MKSQKNWETIGTDKPGDYRNRKTRRLSEQTNREIIETEKPGDYWNRKKRKTIETDKPGDYWNKKTRRLSEQTNREIIETEKPGDYWNRKKTEDYRNRKNPCLYTTLSCWTNIFLKKTYHFKKIMILRCMVYEETHNTRNCCSEPVSRAAQPTCWNKCHLLFL